MIRTSINIDREVYGKIIAAAKRRGVDIEDIIIALMRQLSKKYQGELIAGNAVRYQERNGGENRECVHVRWFDEEYEFLIDMRKVHKKSVSYLIVEAAMTLLDKIISNFDRLVDKYQVYPYYISKFCIHNSIGCIFLWGGILHTPSD